VSVILNQRRDADVLDKESVPFSPKHFWMKAHTSEKKLEKDGFIQTEQTYLLAAQKVGVWHISAAQIKIAIRQSTKDAWGQWKEKIVWEKYYSNGLDISVKPLPPTLKLVGRFSIDAYVDKKTVDSGEAVNFTVLIQGNGNFEDIERMNIDIKGVSVFDEPA